MNSTKSLVRISTNTLQAQLGGHRQPLGNRPRTPEIHPGGVDVGEAALRNDWGDPIHLISLAQHSGPMVGADTGSNGIEPQHGLSANCPQRYHFVHHYP